MIRVLKILPVLLVLPTPLAAQPTLDGWHQYRFGMTRDQVRHLPGPAPSTRAEKDSQDLKDTLFAHTSEYGRNVRGSLSFFGPRGTLNSVGLEFAGDLPGVWSNLSPAQCEAKYQDILHDAEKYYGPFGTRPYKPADKSTTASTRAVPGGQSHYFYTAYTPHALMGNFMADAVRRYGARFVVVQMVDMDFGPQGSACSLREAFVAPEAPRP
jgi:hypothetical protein